MTNPSGTAPRPVIHLLELLSFQTATFAEFRLARERVGYGDEGPLFRAHGVPLNQGAPTRPSGPRPPNGHSMALIFSHPPLPLWFLSMFYFAFFCSFVVCSFVEDLCIVASMRLFGQGRNEPASKSPSVTFAFR